MGIGSFFAHYLAKRAASKQRQAGKTVKRSFICSKLDVTDQNGILLSGSGELSLGEDGICKFLIKLPQPTRPDAMQGMLKVTGKTRAGDAIVSDKAYLVQILNNGWEIVLQVIEVTIEHRNSSSWDTRRYGFTFNLWGPPATATLGLDKLSIQSSATWTELSYELSQATTLPQRDEADALFHLLSISQRAKIIPSLEEVYLGKDLVRTVLRSHPRSETKSPLIPQYPKEICSFLSQTHSKFLAEANNYSLPILFGYYWRIAEETTVEIRFILGSVFMESLKFNWALNVKKYTPKKKSNGLIKEFPRLPPKGGAFEFRELMDQTAAHLGYSGTFTFIEDRNALFHTGAAGAIQLGQTSAYPHLMPELKILLDQIDDLLLRILDYKGPIHCFSERSKVDFPARTPLP